MSVHWLDPHQKLRKSITVELTAMEIIDVLGALACLNPDNVKLRKMDPEAAAGHEAVFKKFKGFLLKLQQSS